MSSIDEASSAVGGNAEAARELSGAIAGSKETISQLAGALASVGVEAKAVEANGAAEDAEQLAAQANTLADALDTLRARIEALRGLVTSSAGDGTPPTAAPKAGAPPAPPYNPKARDPERSAAVRRFGWPKRSDGKTSARGLLYDSSGKRALHAPLKALEGDRVYDTPDLKDEYRARGVATSWHIEGGAAAYMRATQTKEMALWINVPTCGNSGGYGDDDPMRCHANLPKILPEGYTLHVHMELESGWSRQWTYRGTGEALKDG